VGLSVRRIFLGFVSVAALLLGTLIYLVARPTSLYVFAWLDYLGLHSAAFDVRNWFSTGAAYFHGWFLWSLPAGLWIFSGAIAMRVIWWRDKSWGGHLWFSTIPLLGIVSELGQLGVVPGTFDPVDIMTYGAASLIAVSVFVLLENN
jgi:hypothetical protein